MKGPLLSQTLELLKSRLSESSEQYYPILVDLENIIKFNFSKKNEHKKTFIKDNR